MGPFRGRLARDRVIQQADYLGRGDIDGFEEKFGKLGWVRRLRLHHVILTNVRIHEHGSGKVEQSVFMDPGSSPG